MSHMAEQLRVPTVVVHAKDDRTISLARGRQLATLIPGARFVIIEGDHRESTGGTAESRKVILDLIDGLARGGAASGAERTRPVP